MPGAMQFWLGALLFWVVCMAVWLTAGRLLRRAETKKIESRLLGGNQSRDKRPRGQSPALLTGEDRQTGRLLLNVLARFEVIPRLRDWLEQAGLKWHPARLLHACLALALLTFVLLWYGVPVVRPSALPAAAIAGSLPLLYVLRRRRARLRRFEEQFPDSLEFVARSMRAGHAFSVSLDMIHKEFSEPLAGEFRRTFEEHNLGLPLDAALQKLARRVPLMDVQFFVSAVGLQKRTGGNLAELLDKLALVIRERFKLRGRIRAVSAHGRMTGATLTAIPLGVACMMFLLNRDYVIFFVADPAGRMMAAGALLLQVTGYLIIRKIVAIEV